MKNSKRALELQKELARWLLILEQNYQPDKIILFGSYAQNRIEEWSDIDMVIVKETEKSFLERIKEVLLLLEPKVGLDVLVYTAKEFKKMCRNKLFFQTEIAGNGKVIYERGS